MLTGNTTAHQALLAFLRAELDSPSEGERLRSTLAQLDVSYAVITNPNVQSSAENELRLAIFTRYRGSEQVFDGLDFHAMQWHRAKLTERDLRSRVVTCRNTFEARYQTRRLADIASAIDAAVPRVANGVLDRVRHGDYLEPPILLAEPGLERLVILEGHNRLLGYLRGANTVAFPLDALVGIANDLSSWSQW